MCAVAGNAGIKNIKIRHPKLDTKHYLAIMRAPHLTNVRSDPSASFLRASRTVQLFYAAMLSLSLMSGKYCVAAVQTVAPIRTVADTGDREFLAARDAFERRNLQALTASRALFESRLRDHLLADYVEYWWLSANLAQSPAFAVTGASEFQRFLSGQREGVLADALRRDWLRALARRDRWDLFAPEYPRLGNEDAELGCQYWRYRLSSGDREVLVEARALWNSARPAPDACYEVFDVLSSEKLIPRESAWWRVRVLLSAGQLADARRSATYIEKVPASFERQTAAVGFNPGQFLAREKLVTDSRPSVELFIYALSKLARNDSARAARFLSALQSRMPENDAAYAWAQIGLYGAMQHEPEARQWFAQGGNTPLTDVQAAWRVRANLRAGDWSGVKSTIEAMPAAERREPAWRYWLSRSEAAAGNIEPARKLRESLLRENNFYGLLAAEESGIPASPPWQGWKPSAADLEAAGGLRGIRRALGLYRLEMKNEGLREWQYAIRNLNDQQLLAASELARTAGVPDRAINTAERTLLVHDFSQRFPMPYRSDLQAQARAQGLEEAWVYGLIRQESRFMADAKSRVGAAGLMQLMPATARWAAKQVGMNANAARNVNDVPVNLTLGAYYLRQVLDDLGHPVLATAAYNAGPGRARRWQADQALEGAIYAETIPFNETRDYVKKVMANAWYYASQAGTAKLSLREMVGVVPGRHEKQAGTSSLASLSGTVPSMTVAR